MAPRLAHDAPTSRAVRKRVFARAVALLTVLALGAGCAPTAGSPSPATQPPPPEFLFNRAFPADHAMLRATVDREVYPPHYAGAWHTHPGPGSFCTLQGTLTMEVRDGPPVTLSPGECWGESPGVAHRPANRTDREAVALFYLLAPDGQPRTLPAPTPAP